MSRAFFPIASAPIAVGSTAPQSEWIVQGNVILSLTPNSTSEGPPKPQRLYERGQVVWGEPDESRFISEIGTIIDAGKYADESGVETNFQPVAESIFYQDGTVVVSLTPQATVQVDFVVQGSIGLSLTPQATVSREWQVQGAVSLSLMPGATVTREWNVQGSVLLSLTPGSGITTDYPVQGTIQFSLTNSATLTEEILVQGAVSFSLTPSHTFQIEFVFIGSVILNLSPSAIIVFTPPGEIIILGDVTLSLTPGSQSMFEVVIQGNVGLSLLPAAPVTPEYPYLGSIPLEMILNSSYQPPASPEIAGDIFIFLSPSSLVVLQAPPPAPAGLSDFLYEHHVEQEWAAQAGPINPYEVDGEAQFQAEGGWFNPHPTFFGDADEDFDFEKIGERRT